MPSYGYPITCIIVTAIYFLPMIITRFIILRKPMKESKAAGFMIVFSLLFPVLWFFSSVLFIPPDYSADLNYAVGRNIIFVIIALVVYAMIGYRFLTIEKRSFPLKKDTKTSAEDIEEIMAASKLDLVACSKCGEQQSAKRNVCVNCGERLKK